ncbi:MAG TPA: hypothetical protein VFH89_05365 [Sphingomicrobium sp.]|nr:hypothetical protein [Sphingomicrobium sp.]
MPPIDECVAEPSFRKFRAELITAAEKRDMEAVIRALDDKVLVDFGGGSGKAAFREKWTSTDSKEVDLWTELKESLALGCAIRDGVATAPSLSMQLDPDADLFELALAKPGTAVRSGTGNGGTEISTLDWDVVTVIAWSMSDHSVEVRLPDGRTGFVNAGQLRTAGDYRLTMEKRGGDWRITAFVEGD